MGTTTLIGMGIHVADAIPDEQLQIIESQHNQIHISIPLPAYYILSIIMYHYHVYNYR
mgnify:CR=1 FL=1|jgi:hypothetical protein